MAIWAIRISASCRLRKSLPEVSVYGQSLPSCAIVLEAIMGIGAGIISAVKRYSFWDILVTLTTSILVAVPPSGSVCCCSCSLASSSRTPRGAFSMPISGAGGSSSQYQDWMHYVLPAITLASVSTAYAARIMRSQLLDVMNQTTSVRQRPRVSPIVRSSSSMRLRMHSSPSLPILVSTLAACFPAPS